MALKYSKKAQKVLDSLPFEVLEKFYDYSDGKKLITISDTELNDIAEVFDAGIDYAIKHGSNAYYAWMPGKVTAGEIEVFFVFKDENEIERTKNIILDDHPWGEE